MTAINELVCTGPVEFAVPAATPSFIDVSAEITKVIFSVANADVSIPATLATPLSHAKGATTYTVQFDYLSVDGSTGLIFPMLWDATNTADKTLAFTVQFRDGSVSTANPLWSGTFNVPAADVGGTVGELSTGSLTCTLIDAPTKSTS